MTELPLLENNLRESRLTHRRGDQPLNGYRLLSPLGVGGFGEVWKCLAPDGVLKAMKIVNLVPESDESFAASANYERDAIKRVTKIRHPSLVSVDRVDEVSGELLIVMELADSSLLDEFKRHRRAGRPGILKEALLSYFLEVAQALDVMNFQHGLQHLDVKPANLLLCNRHVKLADFDLVTSVSEPLAKGSCPGSMRMTPRYASPELLQGNLSRFCDQYSLAFSYQELLTGELPFNGSGLLKRLLTPPKLEPLPESDRPIVARALAANPDQRYSSCVEFVHALLGLAQAPASPNGSPESCRANLSVSQMEAPLPCPSADDTLRGNKNQSEESSSDEFEERVDWDANTSRVIYPPTIHLSDLRWKPDPNGERAPSLDDFVARLVAAETDHCLTTRAVQESPYREMSAVIESSFIIPTISQPELGEKLKSILIECRGAELSRSERSIVLAVEAAVPFWEIFSSKQRILKIIVNVEAPKQQTEFSRVTVRMEPLTPGGPVLHPRLFDVRSLLLSKIREILQVAPERRRSERWPCHFAVELYPILRDWRFGPPIKAKGVELSEDGIGIIAGVQPPTQRFYLRPSAPNLLSDCAILTEVVRHRTLPDGSFAWGTAFGRV